MSSRTGTYVLVAGPPGSGKTTLAGQLAPALGLPLIGKDAIKEALMDALGAPATVQESRALGRAAVKAMFALARLNTGGAVLESNFSSASFPELARLPGTIVEVRCRCPRELALARYRSRAESRHPGHLDRERSEDELWNDDLLQPLGLGTLIEVDTSVEIDLEPLVRAIGDLARPRGR